MMGGCDEVDEPTVYYKCVTGQRMDEVLNIPIRNRSRENAAVAAAGLVCHYIIALGIVVVVVIILFCYHNYVSQTFNHAFHTGILSTFHLVMHVNST